MTYMDRGIYRKIAIHGNIIDYFKALGCSLYMYCPVNLQPHELGSSIILLTDENSKAPE